MKRHHILKMQFFAGVITAYTILIGAFIYYLNRQNEYANNTLRFAEVFREKADILSNFENELLNMNRVKSDFIARGSSHTILQLNNYANNAHGYLQEFDQNNPIFDRGLHETTKLRHLLSHVSHLDSLQQMLAGKSLEEKSVALAAEEQDIHNTCDEVISAIFQLKKQKIEKEKESLNDAFQIVLPLGIIALLAILYVLYATYKISEDMRLYTVKEKKIKSEFSVANKRFEGHNWILERTNDIYHALIGIDELTEIGAASLQNIAQSLEESFYAGAVYVKTGERQTYARTATLGFQENQLSREFEAGQGILGMAVQYNDYKVYDPSDKQQITLNTTFIERIDPQIVLFPIAHDQEVVGLLELACHVDVENRERIIEYLMRVTRTIAAAIKSSQNHAVVQRLLETTQKQTEELGAQQEELRITNEELLYKTNLLESSEEELRVQQEELSQSNSELNAKAMELENRNLELKRAQQDVELKIQEVEQASQYKSEFMANMSHELRTPLNSILILAKLLQDNKNQNLTADQCKYASVIYGAGSDLLELINQLLDLAKIESGKVEVLADHIDTSMLVQNLENLFKQTAKEKNIIFEIKQANFPSHFVSDEYRLEQVLKNFLSNAFKFTEYNGRITVQLSQSDGLLHFSVIDSGKGIPEDKIQLIFEAFRQEDGSTSRKYGGTGLGLSISREIALLLGGKINLESELEKGSRFTLTIPFTETNRRNAPETLLSQVAADSELLPVPAHPKTPAPEIELPEDAGKARTILVIEDDFNFADILKDFAERFKFNVLLAYDGAQGIEMAKKHLPDAVILDVMLPVSDGWEVLRTLKADASTQNIPVHMMSADTFKQKDILEKGAIGFLSKPVSEQNIKKVFSNIILNIDKDVKKVLLVEDQEVMSDFIKNTFAEQNINILQAFTKKSALEKLKTEDNIDCMVLDITLPDGSGLDLLEQIKTDDALKHIPVIINTAEDLTNEQADRIAKYTKSMIHKDGKSTNRLIDEVSLFLSKINDADYEPIRHKKFNQQEFLESSNLKGKRVLVVDDDMRNVFALTTALQEQDLHIEIANNGLEALELIDAAEQPFDIVLMDIMMPEMDGYEAIERIRTEKKHHKLPIIAVTAKAMKGDHEKLINLGANDYISKPIDMRKLIALMQVWLS